MENLGIPDISKDSKRDDLLRQDHALQAQRVYQEYGVP